MAGLIIPFEGETPKISPDAFFAPTAAIIGDVEIGSGTSIWFGCVLGAGVVIGHAALIHACTITDGTFIGMRATVMDHAIVETGAMAAGCAVVTPGKLVKSGQLWAGTPARYARDPTGAERANIGYLAEHYRELGASCRSALG